MKKRLHLFLWLLLSGILLFSCTDSEEEIDFREAIYGQYVGTRSGTYSDIIGGYDSYSVKDTFTISEYIPAKDSVWITNHRTTNVKAFIDHELTWTTHPWEGETSHRSYSYKIEEHKLTVTYRNGGSGGGWNNTFIGDKH